MPKAPGSRCSFTPREPASRRIRNQAAAPSRPKNKTPTRSSLPGGRLTAKVRVPLPGGHGSEPRASASGNEQCLMPVFVVSTIIAHSTQIVIQHVAIPWAEPVVGQHLFEAGDCLIQLGLVVSAFGHLALQFGDLL